MLVMSMAVGLVPFDPERVIALRRISDVVFRRPVRLGDRIRVEGTLEEVRPMTDDAGLACWRWTIRDGEGRPACRAQVEVLWRRDSGPATTDSEIEFPADDHHGRLPIAL
jgi:acyl dehydratase